VLFVLSRVAFCQLFIKRILYCIVLYTPALWPANSPELNPVDYQIWGKLQEHVYRSQIPDIIQLKSYLIEEWEHFHQVVIDKAVRQWRPRLQACVRLRAHGGHFEHRL